MYALWQLLYWLIMNILYVPLFPSPCISVCLVQFLSFFLSFWFELMSEKLIKFSDYMENWCERKNCVKFCKIFLANQSMQYMFSMCKILAAKIDLINSQKEVEREKKNCTKMIVKMSHVIIRFRILFQRLVAITTELYRR